MHSASFIRPLLFFEGLAFALASAVHRGWFIPGYQHARAATPEGVIAAVLFAGLILTWVVPKRAWGIGVAVQAFAIVGTLAGVGFVLAGIGPQTVPDIVYHVAMLVVLIGGAIAFMRTRTASAGRNGAFERRD